LQATTDQFDEERHSGVRPISDPETLLLQTADTMLIERAMSTLPDRFRELLVLRELEGLSYRELADVMDIPMGTVMSRLSRARQALHSALTDELTRFSTPERTRPRERESSAAHLPEGLTQTSPRALESALAATGACMHLVQQDTGESHR
jgi:Sigma-70, region 4